MNPTIFALCIIAIFIAVGGGIAAAEISDDGLTAKEREYIEHIVKSFQDDVPLSKTGVYARDMAVAIKAAAEQLGMTPQELAEHPMGVELYRVVIWERHGRELMWKGIALLWYLTMIPLWLYLLHYLIGPKMRGLEVKVSEDKSYTESYAEFGELDDETKAWMAVVCVVMLGVLVVIWIVGWLAL